jgi:hypothetical protein
LDIEAKDASIELIVNESAGKPDEILKEKKFTDTHLTESVEEESGSMESTAPIHLLICY